MTNRVTPTTKIYARPFRGETLRFREVETTDAEYIIALRSSEKNRFLLSPGGVEDQRAYIERAREEDQAYFIITDLAGRPCGAVRLYDALDDSFSWGSWLIEQDAPGRAAVESALMVYTYALDILGFKSAYFDVKTKNTSVIGFHLRCGAEQVRETPTDIYYTLGNDSIQSFLRRYRKYLPCGIVMEN